MSFTLTTQQCTKCAVIIELPRMDRKLNSNRELCDDCRVIRQRERNREYMARVAKKKKAARLAMQTPAK